MSPGYAYCLLPLFVVLLSILLSWKESQVVLWIMGPWDWLARAAFYFGSVGMRLLVAFAFA